MCGSNASAEREGVIRVALEKNRVRSELVIAVEGWVGVLVVTAEFGREHVASDERRAVLDFALLGGGGPRGHVEHIL